jgi:hypothetical protein
VVDQDAIPVDGEDRHPVQPDPDWAGPATGRERPAAGVRGRRAGARRGVAVRAVQPREQEDLGAGRQTAQAVAHLGREGQRACGAPSSGRASARSAGTIPPGRSAAAQSFAQVNVLAGVIPENGVALDEPGETEAQMAIASPQNIGCT